MTSFALQRGQEKIQLIVIGGFLGAGKTTTILKAIEHLKEVGLTAVYITNDQGQGLVDTALGRVNGVMVGEVIRGCFCCRFNELLETVMRLITEHRPNVVFAEAVGSCTDLIATVVRPLKRHYGERLDISPYTVMVDPCRFNELKGTKGSSTPMRTNHKGGEIPYLFAKQIEEAQIVALNKIELLSPRQLTQVQEELKCFAPEAHLVSYSAHSGANLDHLIRLWFDSSIAAADRSLDIDYDVYAEAEAKLAWVNMLMQILASQRASFRPSLWIERLLGALGKSVLSMRATVGHVKMQLDTPSGTTKASLVEEGGEVNFALRQESLAASGNVLINARVEADPDVMRQAIEDAVKVADIACGTETMIVQVEAFRPARPQPTHRIS